MLGKEAFNVVGAHGWVWLFLPPGAEGSKLPDGWWHVFRGESLSLFFLSGFIAAVCEKYYISEFPHNKIEESVVLVCMPVMSEIT